MVMKHTGKNGIRVYDLNEICSPDLVETQSILEEDIYTSHISAEDAYTPRGFIHQVGIYQVEIESERAYQELLTKLENEGFNHSVPSYENWLENRIRDTQNRVMKLGKYLLKYGASQQVVDFYSSQIRTGKETVFFTVSDMPQHIAGMTYYSDVFTSCMHPSDAKSVHLAGSLHDAGLVVGMLHSELDDVQDMSGRLLARVVFRVMQYEGRTHLFPTRYYGSAETQEKMDRAIKRLDAYDIHSIDMMQTDDESGIVLRELVRGAYEVKRSEDVHVLETIERAVEASCVLCEGTKIHKVYSGACDDVFSLACPACEGTGVTEAWVNIHIDEWHSVEKIDMVRSYNEGYKFDGNELTMIINKNLMSEHLEKNKLTD